MSLNAGQPDQSISPRTSQRFATALGGPAALALLAALLVWYLRLFDHALTDDAFITLTYVKTLTGAGTWGFFPGHPANTATSPLNVILLSLISRIEGSATGSPVWLAAGCLLMLAVALDRTSSRLFGHRWFGWVATAAFIFNPWLVSTLGLESILLCSLLVMSIFLAVAGRWYWLAFCLGLLVLTRGDGLLFAPIFLLYLPKSRIRVRFVGTLLATIAPWYLFSWISLGSFLPDSLIIRVTQTSWQGADYLSGLQTYLQRYPAATLLSFAFVAAAPALAVRRVRDSRPIRLVLALALSHFLAYSLLDVPPYHWYYAPECAAAILFAMLAIGTVSNAGLSRRLRYGVLAAGAIMTAIPAGGMLWILARDQFSVAQMPIHTNLATEAQYRAVAMELGNSVGRKAVLVEGEIGTLAYYCNCLLLDPFSDRRWLTAGIKQAAVVGGLSADIYRLNFLFLRPDPGFPAYSYMLTVRSDPQAAQAPYLHVWQASSTWSPQSWIVLAEMPATADLERSAGTPGPMVLNGRETQP
jgi:Glycosyltransferase family 87